MFNLFTYRRAEHPGGQMSKRLLAIFALFAALGLSTPSLMADHGDKGNKHGNKHSSDDDQGWERREGYEYHNYVANSDVRPPGWNRGQKTGWKNCGLPPGQAKKYGCRSYVYEGRPHYYYQDDRGQIIVRRPIIEVHGSVDIVR
jgi:hypothetical protein